MSTPVDLDLYRTHGDVAEQVLRGAQQLGMDGDEFVDVGAGSGPWGQRLGFVLPHARRTAIEIRAEERPYLDRWYEDVRIADFRTVSFPNKVDAVIGNPPFFSLTQAIYWAHRQVRRGGWIVYLVPAGYGASADAEELLRSLPPLYSLRIMGRLSFLTDGADFQHHEAFIWRTGAPIQPSWGTYPLPPLAGSSRGWVIPPGRERRPRPLPIEFWPQIGGHHG